jgi:hypothetical protein
MKFTIKKGLIHLVIAAVIILVSLPIANSVEFHVLCILFCIGWLVCWVIGGFFNMD